MSDPSTTRVGFVVNVLIGVKGKWVEVFGVDPDLRPLSITLLRHWTAEGSEYNQSLIQQKKQSTRKYISIHMTFYYSYSDSLDIHIQMQFIVQIIVNGDAHTSSMTIFTKSFIMNLYLT